MTDQTGREAFSAYCREQLGLDVKEVANIAEVQDGHFMIGGRVEIKL